MARGLQNHTGGTFDAGPQQDLLDTDPLHGPITLLTGTADAINPRIPGNYMITTGSTDLTTLAAPISGTDDGLTIMVQSFSAFPHRITTVGLLKTGLGNVNIATFAANPGSNVKLRAFQGFWMVLSQLGITFS